MELTVVKRREARHYLLESHFVMDFILGIVLLRDGGSTAQVGRGAVAFVSERLAGERVVGERHRTFREFRGQ